MEGASALRDARSERRSRGGNGSWYVTEMWEAVRAVNKQLVESPMRAASVYQGYTCHKHLLIYL